jgi:hypothetical protein
MRRCTSMAHPGGRPSKLPKVVDAFLTQIKAALSIEAAAARAGVGRTTMFNWQQRGRKEEKGEYREFVNKLEEADGIAEATMTEALIKAGHQDPKYFEWMLERRFPQRWSLPQQHEVSGPAGGAIPLSVPITVTVSRHDFLPHSS